MENRDRYYEEARQWIGTPFQHQGRQKQIGADCLGLVLGVYEELFGSNTLQIPDYQGPESPQAHRDVTPEFLGNVFCRSKNMRFKRGDVLVFELKPQTYWHVGIASSKDRQISATQKLGVSELMLEDFWFRRLHSVYGLEEN